LFSSLLLSYDSDLYSCISLTLARQVLQHLSHSTSPRELNSGLHTCRYSSTWVIPPASFCFFILSFYWSAIGKYHKYYSVHTTSLSLYTCPQSYVVWLANTKGVESLPWNCLKPSCLILRLFSDLPTVPGICCPSFSSSHCPHELPLTQSVLMSD
jgi:hypothetical protein